MKRFFRVIRPNLLAIAILFPPALLNSCSQSSLSDEKAFVVPERLKIRSSTAQASRIVGELKGGDQVTITQRANADDGDNWSMVKGPNGESGWIKSLSLVKQEVVEKSRKIADEIKEIPTQAVGKSKAMLKLRLSPDRVNDENVATMMPTGTAFEIVARERKPRPAVADTRSDGRGETKEVPDKSIKFDDWYEVRLRDYAVLPAGWIYGGSVDLEVPNEIVYFVSSGRKFTGWQKIGTVTGDDNKTGDHYLVMERKIFGADDRADFDRVKVMAYDPDSRNYNTPFREDVIGRFPVRLKMEGTRGRFQLITIDKNGQPHNLTYSVEMLGGGKIKISKPPKS